MIGARAPQVPDLLWFDALVPVRTLGTGSLCEVLLVELPDGRQAALKRALPQHRGDERIERVLREEAATHAQISHAGVPRLLAHGESRDGPVLVMELLVGAALDAVMDGGRDAEAVPATDAAFVAHQLLDVLGILHAMPQHVVHRDVGAHNVIIAQSGDVALIDFGIALDDARERWTAAGGLRGALAALSPEAIRGEPIGPAADLFAAGALLFLLLTGREPFSARGRRALLSAVASGKHDAIGDPRRDAFFSRALAADPAKRHASARDMQQALVEAGLGFDAATARASWAQRVAPLIAHTTAERTRTKT